MLRVFLRLYSTLFTVSSKWVALLLVRISNFILVMLTIFENALKKMVPSSILEMLQSSQMETIGSHMESFRVPSEGQTKERLGVLDETFLLRL